MAARRFLRLAQFGLLERIIWAMLPKQQSQSFRQIHRSSGLLGSLGLSL
jgi:hypothetical protein